MSSIWFIVLLLLIIYLLIRWNKYDKRELNERYEHLEKYTVLGHFIINNERSSFTLQDTKKFRRHRHGTSSSLDQIWTYDSSTNTYIIPPVEYAILDQDQLTIYEKGTDKIVETLNRVELNCPSFRNVIPTPKNYQDYYDVVKINSLEQTLFQKIISSKKKCASIHDWNLTMNDSILSTGVYLLDKKRTCFFYVPDYLYRKYNIDEVTECSLSDMKSLLFAGVVSE